MAGRPLRGVGDGQLHQRGLGGLHSGLVGQHRDRGALGPVFSNLFILLFFNLYIGKNKIVPVF